MVRYFDPFSCFPVGGDYFGGVQAVPQSLSGLLQQVVAGPEALYKGDNLRVMQIAMGYDPGRSGVRVPSAPPILSVVYSRTFPAARVDSKNWFHN